MYMGFHEINKRKMMSAAREGDINLLRSLLNSNVDPNFSMENRLTPLILAAGFGQSAAVGVLIDNGAFLGARDSRNKTALMAAAYDGQSDATRVLIEATCARERQDILLAARNGDVALVQGLLASGADVDSRNCIRQTPLIQAIIFGHEEVAKLLVNSNAAMEFMDGIGMSPLMWAAMYGRTEVLRALIRARASFEVKPGNERTALMYAANNGHSLAVKMLVAARASLDVRDHAGWTALMCAADNGHYEASKVLIDAGADMNVHGLEDEETALTLAQEKGHSAVVQLLQNAGNRFRQEPTSLAA